MSLQIPLAADFKLQCTSLILVKHRIIVKCTETQLPPILSCLYAEESSPVAIVELVANIAPWQWES